MAQLCRKVARRLPTCGKNLMISRYVLLIIRIFVTEDAINVGPTMSEFNKE